MKFGNEKCRHFSNYLFLFFIKYIVLATLPSSPRNDHIHSLLTSHDALSLLYFDRARWSFVRQPDVSWWWTWRDCMICERARRLDHDKSRVRIVVACDLSSRHDIARSSQRFVVRCTVLSVASVQVGRFQTRKNTQKMHTNYSYFGPNFCRWFLCSWEITLNLNNHCVTIIQYYCNLCHTYLCCRLFCVLLECFVPYSGPAVWI